jgi:predicted NUDIX family NTP pyrophosphohydrolase
MRTELDGLVAELVYAKHEEEEAKATRIFAEEQVAACIDGPESGSKTVTLDDGTKVTVRRGYNYKADLDSVEKTCNGLPVPLVPPVKTKTTKELDVAGYEWYQANHPEIFQKLCNFVTVTPKKVAVEVRRK